MLGSRIATLGSTLALSLSFAAVGCSAPSAAKDANARPAPPPADAAADDAAPNAARFVAGPCRFIVPKSVEGTVVRCGDVIVPENRATAGGREIKLHVAVFPGKQGEVPVLELNGGPGAGSDPLVGLLAAGEPSIVAELAFLRARGDYVMIDQRGVGRSEPNLSCAPETERAPSGEPFEQTMARCRDRLVRDGVDLAAYTSYDNALDIDDVRRALGYDKVDLHGISYGTLLALEIMRNRAQGVRSAVIDGVLPPEEKLVGGTPKTIDDDVTRIFAACAANADCAAAFPDLEGSFRALHEQLVKTPLATREGPLDWGAFVSVLVDAMYAPKGVAQVPLWVHDLAARGQPAFDEHVAPWLEGGDAPPFAKSPLLDEVDRGLAALEADPIAASKVLGASDGMYTSILCSDSAQYETADEARAVAEGVRPGLRDEELVRSQLATCDAWPKAPKRPTTKTPVTSAVPTLSMGGEFDPVTPAAWAEQVTRTLSNGTFVLMRGLSHGSMDACGRGIKSAFFAAPLAGPDATCAARGSIAWKLPSRPGLSGLAAEDGAGAVTRWLAAFVAGKRRGAALMHMHASRAAVRSRQR
jgi:pimeloyl-ACP methyl ester carboxylesterase